MSCNDYASVSKLHGAPILSGASTTFPIPALDDAGPRYVQGVHGFTAPRDGAPTFDTPSSVRIYDARTGAFLNEKRVDHSGKVFPVDLIEEAALARLGLTQDALAPHFFDGEASIPQDLEQTAESYRKDFRRGLQPGHAEFYGSQAGPWMTWVGLLR